TPVGDGAVAGERAEVAPSGDVARSQIEVEPGRAERTASELEALGVVAEQTEVPGAGPGRDAGADRFDETGDRFGREPVEIRRRGLLEFGAVLGVGIAAEAVHDDQQDLRVRGLDQSPDVHSLTVPPLPLLAAAPFDDGRSS